MKLITNRDRIIDEVHQICKLMGPTVYEGHNLVVRSSLSSHELPSLWLAIATDLILDGIIDTLDELPAVQWGDGLALGTNSDIRILPASATITRDSALAIGRNPIVVLAGKSGAGKSTILHALAQRYKIHDAITQTSRPRRHLDPDFATMRYVPGQAKYDFRDASLSLPVLFRRNTYTFSLVDSFLGRFDSTLELVILIDSHPLRVSWRKRLLPATSVIWLDTEERERERRISARGSEVEIEARRGWIDPSQVRANADLVINTSATPLATSVNLIAEFLHMPRR